MGEVHADILKSMPGIEVCGLVDRDADRAAHLAAALSISNVFTTADELVREASLDVVHILTPPSTHAQICCSAIEAGCHVFVEKPMAMTAEEAERMAAAAAQHNRLLTVDHNNRFDPAVAEASRRIAAGHIGDLIGIDVFHNSLPPEAPWITALPSGDWFNDVDHLFYLSEFFLGRLQKVRPVGARSSDGRVAELHIAAENERGWSSLTYSTLTAPFQIRLVLYGSQRTLEVDVRLGLVVERRAFNLHRWLRKRLMGLDVAAQLFAQSASNAARILTGRAKSWSGLRNLLDAYYAAIREGSESPVDMETCLRIVKLKQDIIRQLED
jgi:predicted dehydrogenase